jgi:tight adherence protein B
VVALRSGHSLASALKEWPASLAQALGPGKWVLLPLVDQLRTDIDRGATPEEALAAMAEQVGLEEMRMLAQVVRVARQRGADLSQVVSQAAQTLAETLDVKAQMQSLTAGKRAEGLVITFLPPVMLLVLTLSNPGYAAPLIQTGAGRIILALALLMEAGAFLVSGWLLQGEV